MSSTHSRVHAAARCEEEKSFFRAILADLADLDRQLIYADWLDDRGDDRASIIRDLTAASELRNLLETAQSLLDAREEFLEEEQAASWFNLLGWPARLRLDYLESQFPDAYVPEFCSAVLRAGRPGLRLFVERSEIAASDWGGGSFVVGRLNVGQDEARLVHLDLSDFAATLAQTSLPESGLLSFDMTPAGEFFLSYGGERYEPWRFERQPHYGVMFVEELFFPRADAPEILNAVGRPSPGRDPHSDEWISEPRLRQHVLFPGHPQYPFAAPEPGWEQPLMQLAEYPEIGWNFGGSLGVFFDANPVIAQGTLPIRVVRG